MKATNRFTKALAIAGTLLVWLPVLAPLVFSVVRLFNRQKFLLDFLMPAELFPVILAGGVLLLWAALRARAFIRLTGWLLTIAAMLLAASQGLAVVTGLASGEIKAEGIPFALVLGGIITYDFLVIALGVVGILLLRRIFWGGSPAV